jgi:hypothetical protein
MIAFDYDRSSFPSADTAAQEIDPPEEVGDEGRYRPAVDLLAGS